MEATEVMAATEAATEVVTEADMAVVVMAVAATVNIC